MSVYIKKPTTHLIFWFVAFLLLALAVFIFRDVLLPFVLGLAVAYLLNPAVNRLGHFGLSRKISALTILGLFLIVVVGLIAVLSPIVYSEFMDLYHDLPIYIEKFWALTAPVTAMVEQYVGPVNSESLEAVLRQNSSSAALTAQFILKKITSGGQALLDMISVAVFMPIVAYFMMKEWPYITEWVRGLIPRPVEETTIALLKEIDVKLSGFVRGQLTVSAVLGIGYALALSLAGLKYGFMIGLASGLLSIIPMVGSAVGLIVSIAVAWFQTGDITFVGIIAGIFIIGQVIEGNVLTPKLVGDSVGLHPLWVFFALLAGGSLLGILGMFLAVPVAAVAGVLLTFAVKKYKESPYFNLTPEQKQNSL